MNKAPAPEDLRVFSVVARKASFSAAADELGVSPAYVTKRIRILEADLGTTEAAKALGVSRVSLSRVLNGKAAISSEMALRIERWLGIERGGRAGLWLAMQSSHDLWQAEARVKKDLAKIKPVPNDTSDRSPPSHAPRHPDGQIRERSDASCSEQIDRARRQPALDVIADERLGQRGRAQGATVATTRRAAAAPCLAGPS